MSKREPPTSERDLTGYELRVLDALEDLGPNPALAGDVADHLGDSVRHVTAALHRMALGGIVTVEPERDCVWYSMKPRPE